MSRKRNWANYNKSLVQRGSITFWIDTNFLKYSSLQEPTKGRPKFHTSIIHMGWVLKITYKLTFRALEGYFYSLFQLLGIKKDLPHYSLFCKRGKEVLAYLPKLSTRRPLELVIDASGLKIYGEGEWKTHKHGRENRRRWLKVHVAVDPKSGECISVMVTDEKGADSTQLPSLIDHSPKSVKRVYADGAYDTFNCREKLRQRGIDEVIPPRKGAKIRKGLARRNEGIKELKGLQGDLSLWKKLKGYGRRSLAETFFSRLKGWYKSRLSSTKLENQILEIMLCLHSLNKVAKATL